MKIVVSATKPGLDAPVSPILGRCPVFCFVDTETMAAESVENPALSASGGAGVQAAEYVIEQGAQGVLTQNVGPNAFEVFDAAGVPVYAARGATVREAIEAYAMGKAERLASANRGSHQGSRF
jgi:predicted Fe-Mo cluster-binding NifX family protein